MKFTDDQPAVEAKDEAFARKLIEMAEADALRATGPEATPANRSVASWMVHELERYAERLAIPGDIASTMRDRSRELRHRLRAA